MLNEHETALPGPGEAAGHTEPLWQHCRQLIEASPLPMAAVQGPEFHLCAVNPAFCHLLGAARDALVGRPVATAVPAWAGSRAVLDRVYRTGASAALPDPVQAPPAAAPGSCAAWPVPGPGGRPGGVLILVSETREGAQARQQAMAVTQALVISSVGQHERTEAAESRQAETAVLLETILKQATEEIVVRDAQGRLLLANAAARRRLHPALGGPAVLEGTPLDLVPYLWGTLQDPTGHPIPLGAVPMARALHGQGVPPMEVLQVTPDGQVRVVLQSAAPLRDRRGALIGAVAITTALTPPHPTRADRRQARAALEQRVRERTRALERTADHLRALTAALTVAEQRDRQRLAQRLQEELQQLLVGAKLRVTLLEKTADPGLREACQALRRILDDSVACARTLTGDLGPPILQSGGLAPAMEWLGRWMLAQHGLTVHLEADAAAGRTSEALTLLLFHAARELLVNAVKHAQVDTVRVALRQREGYVHLTVSDQGVGFDPQGVPPTDSTRFGLFSIREPLQFLGGCMDIASTPGQGTCITLAAPLCPPAPGDPLRAVPRARVPPRAAAAPRGGTRRIRVLLVDDHAVVRQGLAAMLQLEPDIEIVGEAADGEMAVELARSLRPDVITMDISLPGMDGIAATRVIHAEAPAIQIIGLSMYEAADQAAAIHAAGAVCYLMKSGPAEALVAAVRAGERAA